MTRWPNLAVVAIFIAVVVLLIVRESAAARNDVRRINEFWESRRRDAGKKDGK